MQTTLDKLAAAGRNGDSMLLHVSPSEVRALAGIAALAGTSLTRNPKTGLPEAFNLGRIMQYAVPIAAGMMFGPMGAAAASGLTSYAATGDVNQALLSGATGAAVGSMASGLGGAAAEGAAAGAGSGAGAGAATGAATDAAAQGVTDAAVSGAATGATAGAAESAAAAPAVDAALTAAPVDATSGAATGVSTLPPASAPAAGTTPAFTDMTIAQKMDALQNADWTGKGGVLVGKDGSIRMAPIIAGGGMMGLAGLQSQQDMANAYGDEQEDIERDARNKFRYYQGFAGSMPANQIPAYRR